MKENVLLYRFFGMDNMGHSRTIIIGLLATMDWKNLMLLVFLYGNEIVCNQ